MKARKVRVTFSLSLLRKRGNIKWKQSAMLQDRLINLEKILERMCGSHKIGLRLLRIPLHVSWDPLILMSRCDSNWFEIAASYTNPNYYKWAICLKDNPEHVNKEISASAEMHEEDLSCEIGYALEKLLGPRYDDRGLESARLCYWNKQSSPNPASGRAWKGMSYLNHCQWWERKDYVADLIITR